MQSKACFITGHRPMHFSFKQEEDAPLCKKIKHVLTEQIKAHYNRGIQRFWIGGAMGVDTWAGEIILTLREQEDYRSIALFVAIPFPTHGADFTPEQNLRYQYILEMCTDSVIVCPTFRKDAYKKRDYYMVEQCNYGIAVYNHDRAIRSGTGMTVNYAVKKKGLPIVLIHPDTAAISMK